MGTKRSYAEMGDESVHASRQANMPRPPSRSQREQQQPPNSHFKSGSKAGRSIPHPSSSSSRAPVGALKKKVRDLSRLLEHSNADGSTSAKEMPADVRRDNERALAAYKQELGEVEEERYQQKMIKRYHMVRFFERQKATRRLKKLIGQKKKHDEASHSREDGGATEEGSGKPDLDALIHETQVDLNYALYCPLSAIYISVYAPNDARSASPEADIQPSERRPGYEGKDKPPLWYEVERRMNAGDARSLEELRSSSNFSNGASEDARPKHTQQKNAVRKTDKSRTGKQTSLEHNANGMDKRSQHQGQPQAKGRQQESNAQQKPPNPEQSPLPPSGAERTDYNAGGPPQAVKQPTKRTVEEADPSDETPRENRRERRRRQQGKGTRHVPNVFATSAPAAAKERAKEQKMNDGDDDDDGDSGGFFEE